MSYLVARMQKILKNN